MNDLCIRRCRAQPNDVTPVNISDEKLPHYFCYNIIICCTCNICPRASNRNMREITRKNLSSGFPTKRVSNQSPRLKIEVLLVVILDTTSKKVDNKVADETARMRRLICAFIVTNHQRQFFSVAVQSL